MKKIFSFTSFFISLSVMSFAVQAQEDHFTRRPYCEINGGSNATCEICNFDSYRPITCDMSIKGRTLYGFWFQGQQRGAIPYGKCMYGYVYANNPMRDPLISAEASAMCSSHHSY